MTVMLSVLILHQGPQLVHSHSRYTPPRKGVTLEDTGKCITVQPKNEEDLRNSVILKLNKLLLEAPMLSS